MKMLRFFFFCVMTLVLPANTVLAQMPAHAKIAALSQHVASLAQDHHAPEIKASKASLHLHQGLFGQLKVHIHEPAPQTDCIKACQAMPGSILVDAMFISPQPLSAVLVSTELAALVGLTVSPLEDPPKLRA
jgi:hypothetical protein